MDERNRMKEALDRAGETMGFLNSRIGPYPHKQLDLILNETGAMEYPGAVTVGVTGQEDAYLHAFVHELVHQ
jgi:hypothetical protein